LIANLKAPPEVFLADRRTETRRDASYGQGSQPGKISSILPDSGECIATAVLRDSKFASHPATRIGGQGNFGNPDLPDRTRKLIVLARYVKHVALRQKDGYSKRVQEYSERGGLLTRKQCCMDRSGDRVQDLIRGRRAGRISLKEFETTIEDFSHQELAELAAALLETDPIRRQQLKHDLLIVAEGI